MVTLLVPACRLALRVNPGQIIRTRGCHNNAQKGGVLKTYWQKVIDNPLPIGAGALVVGILQWNRIRSRNEREELEGKEQIENKVLHPDDWKVSCYSNLPLRHVSRLWGFVNDIDLPVWMRTKVLGWYVRTFGCELSDAEVENLEHYENLGTFFRRRLKSSARPISGDDLISPCDGKVMHSGPVDVQTGLVEQVKGVTYSLKAFLGSYFSSSVKAVHGSSDQTDTEDSPKSLYQCVLYLAPGDYHCFHNPVDWTLEQRRHFPGELLSVNPRVVSLISHLFALQERVAYIGKWKHGFFSMTAVGATNVGSVKVDLDPELTTNSWKWESKTFFQKSFQNKSDDGVALKKGEYFGEFNLGSTIVLIFEAPDNFEFDLWPGKPVKVGHAIQKSDQ
jgi:phosphatidylserine decarboxylase